MVDEIQWLAAKEARGPSTWGSSIFSAASLATLGLGRRVTWHLASLQPSHFGLVLAKAGAIKAATTMSLPL
jgi:hypothetical protein